ncbi:MAG: MYXO-CTERM sorting domain-containing protein [Myxococcota bacterium]
MLRPSLVVVVMALVASVPATAWASTQCRPTFDQCSCSNGLEEFEPAVSTLAPDGVIRFHAVQYGGSAGLEPVLPFVDVRVFANSSAVDGALEYDEALDIVVWRPNAPLAPGTEHSVSIGIDNDAISDAVDPEGVHCIGDSQAARSVTTTLEPLPELAFEDPVMSEESSVAEAHDLDTVVCCDDAYPSLDDCGELRWFEGECSSVVNRGTLHVHGELPPIELESHVEADIVVRMVRTDGEEFDNAPRGETTADLWAHEPMCARMEVVSLARGVLWEGPEQCFGEGMADVLGDHPIENPGGLFGCEGQPYVCEHDGDRWDSERCDPWGDPVPGADESGDDTRGSGSADEGLTGHGFDSSAGGAEDTGVGPNATGDGASEGCACNSDPSERRSSPWLMALALLGVAGLRRRRGF